MKRDTHTFEGTSGYRVVPMHAGVRSAAAILEQAFGRGLTAHRDPVRKDFYAVEIDGVSYYFHVFPARRTAYLLSAELPANTALETSAAHESTAGCLAC